MLNVIAKLKLGEIFGIEYVAKVQNHMLIARKSKMVVSEAKIKMFQMILK